MEEAGELAATEMPDRAARMHCAHGEGSARFAARSRRVRGGRGGGPGADRLARLGRRPAGRPGGAREDGGGQARGGAGGVGRPKSTRPGLFDQHGEVAGGAGPRRCPLARLRDVTETLSIPKSTYLEPGGRAARADPKSRPARAGASLPSRRAGALTAPSR